LVGELIPLPDRLSVKLGLSHYETIAAHALEELVKRHQVLSRERLNWHGTYEHAAQSLIKQLIRERAWQS
jgi:hypothetical protein